MTTTRSPMGIDTSALTGLAERVTGTLSAFLDERFRMLRDIGSELDPVGATLRDFVLAGGKRLRPSFAYWGWRGAGGEDRDEVVRAVACLELLQACALIHDDLIDASATRRGAPSVHRRFGTLHRARGWQGSPESFGVASAILIGDLCLAWADTMLARSGLPAEALARAAPVYDEMRTELMAGQYLDVLEQVTGGGGSDNALRVARYKSAKYTVERPLHLGAALAGAPPALLAAYTAYGIPLGEAFQLRDDLLGVFGDPEETGKPAGDDLREGKRTVLVALTLERAAPPGAALVRRLLGDPTLDEGGVHRLREVISDSGAPEAVEELIDVRTARALAALEAAPVTDVARDTLATLAVAATARRV